MIQMTRESIEFAATMLEDGVEGKLVSLYPELRGVPIPPEERAAPHQALMRYVAVVLHGTIAPTPEKC